MGVHLLAQAWQRASVRAWATATALLTAAVVTATVVTASLAAHSQPGPIAVASRTLSLNLNAKLHLVGRPGHVINEQGNVGGTLSGTASARNESITSNQGTATFTIHTSAGSLSGRAVTRGRVVGPTIYFSGTGRITGGSGRWAHASGSSLKYSGTMDRQNFRVTETITGALHY